jgi:transposase-like protein
MWAAMTQVSQLLGIGSVVTVRKWVRHAEVDVDVGVQPGMPGSSRAA